jgi:hypothetical protein
MGSCPLISSLWSLYHYVGDLIARGYTARHLHIMLVGEYSSGFGTYYLTWHITSDNVIISSSFTKSKCYQCIATVILLGRLFQQFCNVNHPIVRINCILDYVYGVYSSWTHPCIPVSCGFVSSFKFVLTPHNCGQIQCNHRD